MVTVGAVYPQGTIGRFQIAGTASHGLVLDTATGQVWSTYLAQGGGKNDRTFFAPKLSDQSFTPMTPVK